MGISVLPNQLRNLPFQTLQLRVTVHPFHDTSFAIDKEGDGQSEYSAVGLRQVCISQDDGIVDAELTRKDLNGRGIIIHRDTDDLQPSRLVFLLQGNKMRYLDLAGRAPRRPEIQ